MQFSLNGSVAWGRLRKRDSLTIINGIIPPGPELVYVSGSLKGDRLNTRTNRIAARTVRGGCTSHIRNGKRHLGGRKNWPSSCSCCKGGGKNEKRRRQNQRRQAVRRMGRIAPSDDTSLLDTAAQGVYRTSSAQTERTQLHQA